LTLRGRAPGSALRSCRRLSSAPAREGTRLRRESSGTTIVHALRWQIGEFENLTRFLVGERRAGVRRRGVAGRRPVGPDSDVAVY